MTHDLADFTVTDMAECVRAIHQAGAEATSLEDCANRMVRYLYSELADAAGNEACALVRFFKTHRYDALDEELRGFARGILGQEPPSPAMKCLVLMATAGAEPAWNDPSASRGHQAVPLPSAQVVEKIPMISRMIQGLGLEISAVVQPDSALLMEVEQKTCGVFHVPEAQGSPYVPAQAEFVVPYGVRSVLGFGGVLPTGNLFSIILFSRVPISRETAGLFEILAVSAKAAVLPFDRGPTFERERAA